MIEKVYPPLEQTCRQNQIYQNLKERKSKLVNATKNSTLHKRPPLVDLENREKGKTISTSFFQPENINIE